MSSSLSKLVDNLSEGIHNNKCSDCESNLDYIKIKKNGKLILKCFNCNIYYKKKFNKDLMKKFKVFILMNIWIIGKDLMKLHCLVKNNFIAT